MMKVVNILAVTGFMLFELSNQFLHKRVKSQNRLFTKY